MNMFLTIILILLFLSIVGIGFTIIKLLKGLNSQIPPAKIDINLENLNTFIRREFLFEFIKWIMYAPNTIDVNGPVKMPSFIKDLKNQEFLQKKMAVMTTQIISKMSIYLIREFNAVYRNSKEDDSALYAYVTRQIMFYIRRAEFEITALFEYRTQDKPTDLLKEYVLAIEAEIYKLNNILIVEETEIAVEEEDK